MDPVAVTIVLALWSFITTMLWLVIGWQAMRAHERIADNLESIKESLAKRTDE